jgi:hypothetical protein
MKRIILILACSIAIALLGPVFVRHLIDFPVYYAAGHSLIGGRTDLYSPDFALGAVMDYRYPPFFLVMLYPLWLMPYSLAAYAWYILSVLEITGCFLLVARVFPAFRKSRMSWLIVSLAVAQYFVMALHYGNAHLLITFLLFVSFYCLVLRREMAAAALVALAITIKLTPVLLLPYFALKQRWKLLTAVCVLTVVFNIIPSLYFGFARNTELLRAWYNHVIVGQEFHEDNGPIDLSLKGEMRRYLSLIDYSQRVDGDVYYPAVNFARLDRTRVEQAWTAVAAALLAGGLALIWWLSRGPRGSRSPAGAGRDRPDIRDDFFGAELAFMMCLTLLVGPLTSKIYFIALLWPVACLANFAVDTSRQGKFANRVLIALAAINLVLPLLPGRSIQRLFLVVGVDFYLNCLVIAALTYFLVRERRAFAMRSGAPQTQGR